MANEPFLKWPGGKRWLALKYAHLFPTQFDRYVEPFLGGGAVFFRLAPAKSLLADANEELINAYRCVRSDAPTIEGRLRSLHKAHDVDLYYQMRDVVPRTPLGRAVRFLYLNRTCFNGLYRVNKKGQFNVPIGSKTEVAYAEGTLKAASKLLRRASLRAADFEETIDETGRGDFLFVDPPYTVMHNTNNFIKYNAHLFSWADQERLAKAVRRAASRGAQVMLSNADHRSVRELYKGFGKHHHLDRATILAADAGRRVVTTELLVSNVGARDPYRR